MFAGLVKSVVADHWCKVDRVGNQPHRNGDGGIQFVATARPFTVHADVQKKSVNKAKRATFLSHRQSVAGLQVADKMTVFATVEGPQVIAPQWLIDPEQPEVVSHGEERNGQSQDSTRVGPAPRYTTSPKR